MIDPDHKYVMSWVIYDTSECQRKSLPLFNDRPSLIIGCVETLYNKDLSVYRYITWQMGPRQMHLFVGCNIHFETQEEAMIACDKELIDLGYEIVSEERAKKLAVLL